jgi:hypothetical protein
MTAEFRQRVAEGVAREGLKPEWGNHVLREYETALGSYTYLALD